MAAASKLQPVGKRNGNFSGSASALPVVSRPHQENIVDRCKNFEEIFAMTRCGEIMKLNPVRHMLTASLQELASTIKSETAGPLPIVDIKNGNKLLGVVTYRDLIVGVLAEGRDPASTRALDVISHQKQFCKCDDSIGRAITLMDRYHVTELPVVDANMHLVGTISQSDIAKQLEDPELPPDPPTGEITASGDDVRTIL